MHLAFWRAMNISASSNALQKMIISSTTILGPVHIFEHQPFLNVWHWEKQLYPEGYWVLHHFSWQMREKLWYLWVRLSYRRGWNRWWRTSPSSWQLWLFCPGDSWAGGSGGRGGEFGGRLLGWGSAAVVCLSSRSINNLYLANLINPHTLQYLPRSQMSLLSPSPQFTPFIDPGWLSRHNSFLKFFSSK